MYDFFFQYITLSNKLITMATKDNDYSSNDEKLLR